MTYFEEETVSLLDYFSKEDALVFLDEPVRAIEKGRVIEKEFQESMKQRLEKGYILPGQMDSLYSYKEIAARLAAHKVIGLAALEMKEKALPVKEYFSIQMKTVNPYNNSFELLIKDLKRYKKEPLSCHSFIRFKNQSESFSTGYHRRRDQCILYAGRRT